MYPIWPLFLGSRRCFWLFYMRLTWVLPSRSLFHSRSIFCLFTIKVNVKKLDHHGHFIEMKVKAMLHEAIFLATCNATMANKKPFKLQRGCYTQATCLATLRKVEGRSTFLAIRNATVAVAKWGVTPEFFLATCNATFVALQVARKIASCNLAFKKVCSKQQVSEVTRCSHQNQWSLRPLRKSANGDKTPAQ